MAKILKYVYKTSKLISKHQLSTALSTGFLNLHNADSHLRCCHRALCYRTDTGPSVPHSTSLRSEARGQYTPCRRIPHHPHMFWSTAAMVPMSSSHRPQPPAVKHKQKKSEKEKEQPEYLVRAQCQRQSQLCSPNHSLGFWV